MNMAGGFVSVGLSPSAIVQLARPRDEPTRAGCERSVPAATVLRPFLKRQFMMPIQLSAPSPVNSCWPEPLVLLPAFRQAPECGRPNNASAWKRSCSVAPRALRAALPASLTVPATATLSLLQALIVTAARASEAAVADSTSANVA